jgi:hypothetical protein
MVKAQNNFLIEAQIPVCAGGEYRYKIYFREDFYIIVWRFEADSIIGFLNRERGREILYMTDSPKQ